MCHKEDKKILVEQASILRQALVEAEKKVNDINFSISVRVSDYQNILMDELKDKFLFDEKSGIKVLVADTFKGRFSFVKLSPETPVDPNRVIKVNVGRFESVLKMHKIGEKYQALYKDFGLLDELLGRE